MERSAAAVRLPELEAQRQGEIAALTRTATDDAPFQGGFMGDVSRGLLRGKHGIDLDAVEDEQARSPQTILAREAERQVELSKRIQIQAVLGHWGE